MDKDTKRQMRIDIRLGYSVEQLSEKYDISKFSAAQYRSRYLKVLEKQKD